MKIVTANNCSIRSTLKNAFPLTFCKFKIFFRLSDFHNKKKKKKFITNISLNHVISAPADETIIHPILKPALKCSNPSRPRFPEDTSVSQIQRN